MAMRYYFDLSRGDVVLRDESGVALGGLGEALLHAGTAIQEMRRNGELTDESAGWTVIIRDDRGVVHATVPVVPARDGRPH